MMGIDPEMQAGEREGMLAPGDVALLYTDGLFSLKTITGERFTGEAISESFAEIAGSAQLIPRLIAELVQRSGGEVFDDDLAAITLRRALR